MTPCCWLCGERFRKVPRSFFRLPGSATLKPMHTACAMIVYSIHQSPAIERERNAVMTGPRYCYDWRTNVWY